MNATPTVWRRRKMDPIAGFTAVSIGAVSLTAGRIVAAADANVDSAVPFATQLGVFAVCLGIALFMLRRSDQRDATSKAAELAAHDKSVAVLQAQLEAERKRADAAEARASAFEHRLIETYRQFPTEQA